MTHYIQCSKGSSVRPSFIHEVIDKLRLLGLVIIDSQMKNPVFLSTQTYLSLNIAIAFAFKFLKLIAILIDVIAHESIIMKL